MDHDKRRARQALRNYKRMLALEPSHTGHLEQIARLLVELGDPRQAARYFLQRADVLEARNEPAAALASVRAALECDPHNNRARDMLSLLRRTAPPDEILLPEGEDAGLLPVNDALLATNDPLLRSDGIELEDDESFMRDAFLPRSTGRPRSLPPRAGTRPAADTRPVRGAGDDLSSVVARLSAGLSRVEPSAGPPPAALGDEGPVDRNELLSDLSEIDRERLTGESTRDFTVEKVDHSIVGEATLENRVAGLTDDSLDTHRGVYDRYAPEPLDRGAPVRRSQPSRPPGRSGDFDSFDRLDRGVELDDFENTQMLTSGEIEVLGELADGPLDVVADQVIEIRPDSGALPDVAAPAPQSDRRATDRRRVDRRAYPRSSSPRTGYDRGYDRAGYESDGFDRDDFGRDDFGRDGDRDGYDRGRDGYDRGARDRSSPADRTRPDGIDPDLLGPDRTRPDTERQPPRSAAPARSEQATPNVRRGAPVEPSSLGLRPDISDATDLDLPMGSSLQHDYAAYRREQVSRPVEARFHAGEIRLSSLFAALPRPLLDDLISRAEHRTVRIGVPIVRAGDRFEGPFIVTRGRVAHETDGDNRRRARLHPTEPGDLFGLVELVRGGRWRATARAELECDLLRLPVRAVDDARGDHPRWEQALRDVAGRRLADHLLASSALFGHMEPGLRSTLGRKFETRMFGSGEQLIEPGERVDGLYLVIAGEVDVEQDDAYLTTLGAGDLVGIVAALEKTPTRVRAVAATPVEAFHLDSDALRLALDVPEVRAAFTAAVDRRRTVLEGGQY